MNEPTAGDAAQPVEFVGEKPPTEPTVLELLKQMAIDLHVLTLAVCAGLEQEPGEE